MRVGTLGLTSIGAMALSAAAVWWAAPLFATSGSAAPASIESLPSAVAIAPSSSNDAPASNGALRMNATVGPQVVAAGSKRRVFVELAIDASDRAEPTRAPVDVVMVLDRSGATGNGRLDREIDGARAAARRLRDGDAIAIVTFDAASKVVLPRTTISSEGRGAIAAALSSITIGGDACLSCGLEEGISALDRSEAGRRIVLVSAGAPTAGVRDTPGFRSIAQRAASRRIAVTTIGLGLDYDARALAAIAEESNGGFEDAEDEGDLASAFERAVDADVSAVASDAEATIDLAPGVELDRVFDRSFQKIGSRVVVPLGAFVRGEKKSVLVSLRVDAGAGKTSVATTSLALAGRVPAPKIDVEVASSGEDGPLDPIVAARVARSEAASAIDEADRFLRDDRADDARKRIESELARQSDRASQVLATILRRVSDRIGRVGGTGVGDEAKRRALEADEKDRFDLRR